MKVLDSEPTRGHRDAGFTLMEVLVVLAIISLVAVLVAPRFIGQLDGAKQTAARVQLRSLASALETYRLDMGRYPTEQEGLTALFQTPSGPSERSSWRGPYLDEPAPNDPWGRPYIYETYDDPSARPRLGTLGADGKPGGAGIDSDEFVGGSL